MPVRIVSPGSTAEKNDVTPQAHESETRPGRGAPVLSATAAASRELRLAYFCFFISGATALIYEVAWLSRIQLIMGHTVYSLATTVAAYLSGLALGALAVPRLKRSGISSMWLYFLAELGVGVYGLVFQGLLRASEYPYNALVSVAELPLPVLSVVQFIFCGAIVAVPTFLMGTTLPLLCDHLFKGRNELSRKMPTLYAINTVGAAAGVVAAGFWILPGLGFLRTTWLAAGLNAGLFLLAAFFLEGEAVPRLSDLVRAARVLTEPVRLPEMRRREDRAALGVLFASGLICTVVQVVWNRLAALVFGPSVFIFPLVTVVVLVGIVAGSLLARRAAAHAHSARLALTGLPLVAAVTLVVGTYALTRGPLAVLHWHARWHVEYPLYYFLSFGLLLACLGAAATALGALFPLACSVLTSERENPAEVLGVGYAVNVAGLVMGTLAGSFFALPMLGLEMSITAVAAGLALMTAWLGYRLLSRARVALAAVLVGGVAILIVPSYDRAMLTSGEFYNRSRVFDDDVVHHTGFESLGDFVASSQSYPVAYQDDPHATISIHGDSSMRWFRINGKTDGGTGSEDMKTVNLLAVLPALLKPDARSALVVGLGTGTTTWQMLKYPEMRKVTLVELSKAMLSFSRKHFGGLTPGLWDDARLNTVNRDGREYLRHAREQYDVIVSEPSNPWVDGVASLFTKEYFETVADRLTPDGVASLWFHTYGLSCEAVRSVLLAAAQVFPSAYLFGRGGDLFLLASRSVAATPSAIRFANNLQEVTLLSSLDIKAADRAGPYETLAQESILMDRGGLLRFAGRTPANTDDNQLLQYTSGRTFWRNISCDAVVKATKMPAERRKMLSEAFRATLR